MATASTWSHHAPVTTKWSYIGIGDASCHARAGRWRAQVDRDVALLAVCGAVPQLGDDRLPRGPVRRRADASDRGAGQPAPLRRRHAVEGHRRLHVGLHRRRLRRVGGRGEIGADGVDELGHVAI